MIIRILCTFSNLPSIIQLSNPKTDVLVLISQGGSFFVYINLQRVFDNSIIKVTYQGREIMNLKVTKQSETGLNTEFVNIDTGRHVTLDHAIQQINNGNPNYMNYQAVNLPNGTTYIRSKADGSKNNNIEG